MRHATFNTEEEKEPQLKLSKVVVNDEYYLEFVFRIG